MENRNYLKNSSFIKYFLFLILYYFLYLPSFFLYHSNKKCIICERGTDAQDNGFIFYKYLKENHKDIKIYYLLTKKSPDRNQIENSDFVPFGSLKHFMLCIGCKIQISSHLFGYCPWSNFMLYLRKHKTKNVHVFLQHGITYNNQYGFYKKNCKALKLYICGSVYEQNYICETFGYSKSEAVLTGFARFDNLYNNIESTSLVIMPTWRRYLSNVDEQTFIKSNYFKNWHSLLNNHSLKSLSKKYGLDIVFYLHSSLQPYSNKFENLQNINVIKYGEKTVQEILKNAKLLITDYSSVFFDCLYMNKNVILYQFDKSDFIKNHYSEGYIRKLDNSVVPTEESEKTLIEKIQKMLDNNNISQTKEITDFSNSFFGIKDQQNCSRIYEAISSKL